MKLVVKNQMYKIGLILQGATKDAINLAVARSANRAAISMRVEVARRMKERYNLPINGSSKGGRGLTPPGIKESILIQKAKSTKKVGIGDIAAIIRISNRPVSMIHFVKGPKAPANQKGIPVKKRKVLKVQITRGNTKKLPGAFILKSNGSVQVYRRGARELKKQSVPSLFKLAMKPVIKKAAEAYGAKRFADEMRVNVPYYMSRLK